MASPRRADSAGNPTKLQNSSRLHGPRRSGRNPDARAVLRLREHGTEYAFTSPLDKNYAPGTYHAPVRPAAVLLGNQVRQRHGLPSFWKPLDNAIGTSEDYSLFMMKRIEVHCRLRWTLGSRLRERPAADGLRYCINGVALKFVPATEQSPS